MAVDSCPLGNQLRNQPGSNSGMQALPKSGFDFDKSPGLFFDQLACIGRLGHA